MKTLIKTHRIMFKITTLLFLALLSNCKKDSVDAPVTPVTPVGNHLEQYGVPYASVPQSQDAIIYQVNMRAFSATHNFQGVIDRLDNIKALGINVIYLMPISPVGVEKSVNSPYCLKSYKTVNSEFGTIADLRKLVDGAHSRDMAVMLDWVGNHTAYDHAWATQHKNWYELDAAGNFKNPNGWTDVIQLNFTNQEMRQEMIHTMMDWVYTANVDGFRCDYSDGPPADFWKQAIDSLKTISTHKILMLAEGSRSANYSSGFNYNFGFAFYDQLKKTFASNQSVKLLENYNTSDYSGANNSQYMIRYITNHDVNSSDGTPLDLFGGKTGSMAAFIVAAYMKSVPMIYNGQEVALSYKLTFPFTSSTINWTGNEDVTAEYTKVIAFRKSSSAIKQGTLTPYSSDDVCAFTKASGTEKVFVLSNLRNKTVTYTLPADLQNTTWNDAMSATPTSVTLTTSISMAPYSYRVLQVK